MDSSCTFRSLQGARPGDALPLVEQYQRRHRVWLTVHDIAGVLELPDGTRLLAPPWFSHHHPKCRQGRPEDDPSAEAACLEHCYRRAHAFAARSKGFFEHRCWRGQRELVVPILDEDDILCLTLFAAPRGRRWPDLLRLQTMAWEAHAIGRLLIRLAEEAQGLAGDSDRKRIVQRLLAFHSHQPTARDTVARKLGVSPSRASHIVTELFGKPWRELVVDSRVQQACRLLRQPELKIRQIASLCGYDDANTFSRLFRTRTGLSPRAWRRKQS